MQPPLIVLDEPTSNLDLDAISELREIILQWKKQGKTVVIAEHRLGWLNGICDRVLFMENGSISREFTGAGFFAQPTAELNAAGLRAVTEKRHYLETDTGVTAIKPFENNGSLRLNNFVYSYRKHKALDIPGLEIPAGSVCAVVGHNGAGKSTFVKCLCGLQKGFRGTVTLDGKVCKPKDMRRISYMVMQNVNHQLFAESVLEEAMLGMENEDTDAALEMLQKLGIAEYRDRHPRYGTDRAMLHVHHPHRERVCFNAITKSAGQRYPTLFSYPWIPALLRQPHFNLSLSQNSEHIHAASADAAGNINSSFSS